MINTISTAISAPIKDLISNNDGYLSRPWEVFFRTITNMITPFGIEKNINLENNITTPKLIEGLSFNSAKVSFAIIEFLIQRISTGSGATEIVTSGTFHVVYKPSSNIWVLSIIGTPGPSVSGVTFTISNNGQISYTSTNTTGTPLISKFCYRVRSFYGKNTIYSEVGL